MVDTELEIIKLRDDFYRDGFYKVLLTLLNMGIAITLLVLLSMYLIFSKPSPVSFVTAEEWRLVPPVPINQPYLNIAELIQWVAQALPQAFTTDFINYDTKLAANKILFTDNGWKVYNDFVNRFISKDSVVASRYFVSATLTNAPTITNQGILDHRYSWWVTLPLSLSLANFEKSNKQDIQFQVLVTRVSTLNNLDGVAIENMVMSK